MECDVPRRGSAVGWFCFSIENRKVGDETEVLSFGYRRYELRGKMISFK